MFARLTLLGLSALALAACDPPANEVVAETAAQSSGNTAMPEGLNSDQRLVWSTMSDSGKAQVNACLAGGKSFTVCTAP